MVLVYTLLDVSKHLLGTDSHSTLRRIVIVYSERNNRIRWIWFEFDFNMYAFYDLTSYSPNLNCYVLIGIMEIFKPTSLNCKD